MLAGQIVGPSRLEMIEVPVPEPADGQILVRMEAGALCGSDLPFFRLDREDPFVADLPVPLPPLLSLHEIAGHVAVSRCDRFQEGDRVLALPYRHLGMAEYFLSEPAMAVPLP